MDTGAAREHAASRSLRAALADGTGTDNAGTSLVVADLVHAEKLNKEGRHGTGRQCHRNPLPDTQHRGDNGPLGLSINSGPEAMQIGRASCRERVCQYV